MNIFIAGARSVKDINDTVKNRLMSIYKQGFNVLIGDCYGVDASVQGFFHSLHYGNVTVFASNGRARNNIGNWVVKNVSVPNGVKGFDFYKQKDIAMAENADYGFMIWDGKSKGTLNNIINLTAQNKKVLICMSPVDKMIVIHNSDDLKMLVSRCERSTQTTYYALSGTSALPPLEQLTLSI